MHRYLIAAALAIVSAHDAGRDRVGHAPPAPQAWWEILLPGSEAAGTLSVDESGGCRYMSADSACMTASDLVANGGWMNA